MEGQAAHAGWSLDADRSEATRCFRFSVATAAVAGECNGSFFLIEHYNSNC